MKNETAKLERKRHLRGGAEKSSMAETDNAMSRKETVKEIK